MLRELNGALDFGVFLRDDKESYKTAQNSVTAGGRDLKQTRFEENLNLYGRASVYHPNFLDLDFDTTLGIYQSRYSGDFSETDQGSIDEYDISAYLLKEKPLNARFFTTRQNYEIDREFLEAMDVELETYGSEVHYLGGWYNLNLLVRSLDTKEDSSEYYRKRTEDTGEFRFETIGDRLIETDFRYTRRMTTDDYTISTDLDYDDLILNNNLNYGNISGRSYISYYRISEDFESDTFIIIENFDVTHSDTLQTFYNYNFNRYDTGRGDFTSNINYVEGGLRHQLYESLRTTFSFELSHTDDDNYEERYYAPNLSLAYTKDVPLGRFSAVYDGFWRRTDTETKSSGNEAGVRRVFSEPAVLRDFTWTVLKNTNIILDSVVVRDEGGALLVEDIDYELIQSGSLTEIRRALGTSLPNPVTVLVDYDFIGSPDLDYDTVGQMIDLRYDLTEFVSLFYNNTTVEQRNIEGDTDYYMAGSLNDTKRRSFGSEMRWRWFDFFTEWEKDSSDINPYTARRVKGNFSISPTRTSFLTLSADRSTIDYEGQRGTEKFTSARLSFHTALSQYMNTDVRIEFFKDDGFDSDEELWKYSCDLNYRFRLLEFEFKGSYIDRQETYQDREFLRLDFRIIRHFSIL